MVIEDIKDLIGQNLFFMGLGQPDSQAEWKEAEKKHMKEINKICLDKFSKSYAEIARMSEKSQTEMYEKTCAQAQEAYENYRPPQSTGITGTFWRETTKGIKIIPLLLRDFLVSQGFGYILTDKKSEIKINLVKFEKNIIFEVDINYLRTSAMSYLDSQENSQDIKEVFQAGVKNYLDENLMSTTEKKRIEIMKDSPTSCFIPFQNGLYEISMNGIGQKDYSEAPGYIWKNQIIPRNFTYTSEYENSDFYRFTRNICTLRKDNEVIFSEDRWTTLKYILGYMIHNNQSVVDKKAVILTEDNLDDSSQGGTGKGLLMQAIGKIREVCTINGKGVDFSDRFHFQNVNLSTQIIFLDDIKKNFNFEDLYSQITEGVNVEKKNKDKIVLSPEESPKFVLSTNYAVSGTNESAKRRKIELELHSFYNSSFTPLMDFGRPLFEGWSIEDWNMFYSFIFDCIKEYFISLQKKEIPTFTSETNNQKKLISSTCPEFIEFAEILVLDKEHLMSEEFANFINFSGSKITAIQFSKYLGEYCKIKSLKLEKKVVKKEGKAVKVFKLLSE